MIPLSQLLDKAVRAFPGKVKLKYSHPSLYVVCAAEEFRGLSEDARLELFGTRTSVEGHELAQTLAPGAAQLILVTPEEGRSNYDFLDLRNRGHHWIEFLGPRFQPQNKPERPDELPTVLHFYGFKGGQGRSTVLALLAKHLADDGYRVLAVDSDLEAPSLDILLSATSPALSGTFLGSILPEPEFRPIAAYSPRQGSGTVDLIPCRPRSVDYDLDFAAFALRSALDVLLPEETAAKIRLRAKHDAYDLVLFDHRSGLSTSVLPIMAACPGPVAICLRLDEQSSAALGFFDILLQQNPDQPGLFVSFSLDPEDTPDRIRNRGAAQIDQLLAKLGEALAIGASRSRDEQLELPLSPEELSDFWVPWFHDRALLVSKLPSPSDISKVNIASLQQIRTLIGVAAKKNPPPEILSAARLPALSGSGGTDEGLFIETEALRRLKAINTPDTYIFGRKGTGKTRLLRELADRQLGEPLVVASDFQGSTGIQSSDGTFKDLSDLLAVDPEKFWWVILSSALGLTPFASRENLLGALHAETQRVRSGGAESVSVSDIVEVASRIPQRRVFLVDGIETAFLSSRLLGFLEGLFKFLLSLQSNPKLQEKVTIRLFLRSDLARRAFQNIEQQISGRVIYLSWDTQTILNFVLSRISALPWYASTFGSAVDEIKRSESQVLSGSVPLTECDRILSQIFPQKIRRNNLLTLTFLKTYFSDSAGETATYYPRIYDRFLHLIDDPSELGPQFSAASKMEDQRVSQALIFAAHERASKDYLQQVEAELVYLLRLAPDHAINVQRVKELLQAFAGLPTPFAVDKCVQDLKSKLEGISESDIRAALVQMREVGIFEDRTDYPGEWRVGRLFKSSLGMKYVR